jgi:uncharacterized protein
MMQVLPSITDATPWWRYRMVWLVIAGPAAVVAASFVTLALAILHPDPPLTLAPAASPAAEPALQARNHAAAPRQPALAAVSPP